VAGKEFTGAAYVFGGSESDWLPRVELKASDPVAEDQFGCSLALSGTRALIGAESESDLSPMLPAGALPAGGAGARALGSHGAGGVAYVFDGSGATWSQDRELTAADAAPYDCFGQSVALSGTTALIGACDKAFRGHDYAGAVYAESLAPPTLTLRASLRTVKVGSTVTLKGAVKNFVSSAMTVRLCRKVGARLSLLKTVKLSNAGAFRWALKPGKAGTWVIVASYKAGGLTFKSKAVTVSARR
jgi:FG-GAP repeat